MTAPGRSRHLLTQCHHLSQELWHGADSTRKNNFLLSLSVCCGCTRGQWRSREAAGEAKAFPSRGSRGFAAGPFRRSSGLWGGHIAQFNVQTNDPRWKWRPCTPRRLSQKFNSLISSAFRGWMWRAPRLRAIWEKQSWHGVNLLPGWVASPRKTIEFRDAACLF